MKRFLARLVPSPSMAVALLALTVALGGTSYAVTRLPSNSVSTKQIKNTSVTRAKIKNNAVDSSKVAADSLTGGDIVENSLPVVPSAANAANAAHANSTAGIDRVLYRTAAGVVGPASPPTTDTVTATAVATCDLGQHVTGGGVRVDDASKMSVVDNSPGGTTSWNAQVDNQDTVPHGFTVFAVCVAASEAG